MSPISQERLTRWLEAEDALEDEAAEQLFEQLAADLPDLGPRPGFSDRVMARVRAESPAPALGSARWLRGAIGAAVLGCGLAAIWFAPLAWLVVPRPSAASGLRLVAELAGRFGELIASLVGWSAALGAAARALGAPFDRPTVAVSLSLLITLSASAFFFLQSLLRRERSWLYVES